MMTVPGFSSPVSNPAPFVVTAEAFLGLTSQVQALAGMVQTIVSYLPQLMHSTTHQPAPPMVLPQTKSPVAPNRGPRLKRNHHSAKSWKLAQPPRLWCQLRHKVTPAIRGEIGESSKGGSPFTPEIQGKPFPATFRLPTLEPYDGSGDPTKHITTIPAQMALYDTSNALMCRAFPTTLRGSARTCPEDTCVGISATNPHSPAADPLGTRCPDPKVRSRSKSTSSSEGQPRAVTAPRRARPMHDLRSRKGWHMTKALTSRSSREARSSHAMMMRW
ncbi:hypothetical protein B296_00000346 [Ensete ventricosum]|uniref:Uncharacterized protein n=1 Tax=Ensete ventricosum TaxID=4639 RepID=A0A427B2Q9_ENSVE|nr:hypothetical protein B296_00000346 [Ensete ventricosum]